MVIDSTTFRIKTIGYRHGFQQRGLTTAVLTYKKGDGRMERQTVYTGYGSDVTQITLLVDFIPGYF